MFPSLEHHCWEEQPPKCLAMKISWHFIRRGEMEGGQKPRYPLIEPAYRLSHSQALKRGSSRETISGEVPETYREILSYVALGRGLEEKLHCSCVEPSSHVASRRHHLSSFLCAPSPIRLNLNFPHLGEPCLLHPGDSQVLCTPHPPTCTTRSFFMSGSHYCPALHFFLNSPLRSASSRQAVANLMDYETCKVTQDSALVPNLH